MPENAVVALGPGLRALALAVMRQAVEDAQLDPEALKTRVEDSSLRPDARTGALLLLAWHEQAKDFLRGNGSGIWLDVLGVDQKAFTKRWRKQRVRL